jgi:ketosteroid isomerase-like protein
VITRLFEALDQGDRDGVLALVDPEVDWHPTVWSGGTAHGRRGVAEWLDQFGADLRDLEVDLAELEGRDDHVLALGTVFDRRTDQPFAVRVGWIFGVGEGLVIRGRAFESWEQARAAFGSA